MRPTLDHHPLLLSALGLSLSLGLGACGDDGAATETSATTDATATTSTTGTTTGGESTPESTGEATDTTAGEAELLRLTILHNNDGESQLLDAGAELESFGGVDRFVTKLGELRDAAEADADDGLAHAAVVLSSGDNFLAGPEFSVSLTKGPPFYDALALDAVAYDAICLGNHDFDFGPDTLADFIGGFEGDAVFLSANLDVSQEPALALLADGGRIAKSVVVDVAGGHRIGIVGATTPMLPFISSPRDVVVDSDVAAAIQAEVDALEADGVDKIILISHLQSLAEDLELAPLLTGVDVMIAGGGDEVLANAGDLLIPGDEEEIYGPYPLTADNGVPIVTTKGNYRYIGRLVVDFDASGEVVAIADDSGVVRIAGAPEADGVAGDPAIHDAVIVPLVDALAALAANVVATSEVVLDGKKSAVRTVETNQGDLIADALLWQASALAGEYGAKTPTIALQNAGGIRNDSEIPAGDVSELDTFDMLPFPNFITVVEDVPPAQLKEILENAVSNVENSDGRFAQIAGFKLTYDPGAAARELDDEGNVLAEGERVVDVILDDDTAIILGGAVEGGAPDVSIATIDFLARGGDQYPYGDAPRTTLGVSYQQALLNYIVDGLAGMISAADYPEGGEGRISAL
jgi:5'-nucleotidase